MSDDPRRPAKEAAGERNAIRDRILDAALELGEERGWANVRLYQVAERAGVSLATIGAEFRDLDALADAWFARALAAIERIPSETLGGLAAPERLHLVLMRWFDALGAHRGLTGEMLRAKLYPGHPQHWVPLVFDLSRLIHWFLDAARIASTGRARQMAEIGLTAIFVGSLRVWQRDDSPGSERTRAYLRRRLDAADRLIARLG